MSDLVSELVKWTESGYVDRGVWTYLSSSINATALPTNPEALQLPAAHGPQPTQLTVTITIVVFFCNYTKLADLVFLYYFIVKSKINST